MGDASSDQVHTIKVSAKGNTFSLTVKGLSKEAAEEWFKTHMTNISSKSCSNCAKEKKCQIKEDTHKNEPYAKPQVDKKVCRDQHCKIHFNKPIMQPSKVKNVEPPPPFWRPPLGIPFGDQPRPMYPPPFWHPQDPMYHPMPPPSLLSGHELSLYGFPNLGGYNGQW